MFPIRDNIPSRRIPVVNYLIVVINVVVFFNEIRLEDIGSLHEFLNAYGLVPARFFDAPALYFPDILTSMFLHGGWAHIISNMWFLLIFGDNVEDALGHVRYIFFYLLVGVGAAAAQLAANPAGTLPMIGASGAIAGILGGYFVLYPKARVLAAVPIFYFIRLIEIPAFFFLGIWFLMQTINGLGALSMEAVRGEMGGVAWWAHAGGFAAGFAAIFVFRR